MYGEGQMDNGFLAQVLKASSKRVEVSWADWGGEGALVKEPSPQPGACHVLPHSVLANSPWVKCYCFPFTEEKPAFGTV